MDFVSISKPYSYSLHFCILQEEKKWMILLIVNVGTFYFVGGLVKYKVVLFFHPFIRYKCYMQIIMNVKYYQ